MNNRQSIKLIGEINSILLEFEKFSKIEGVNVKITSNDEGNFYILIFNIDRTVRIRHGTEKHPASYNKPSTINMLLCKSSDSSSCSVIMTECEIESFPKLLRNAYELTNSFLNNKYSKEKGTVLGLIKQEYLRFEFDDPTLVYKFATKLKKYVNLN